ncbi:sulfurtransferase [Pelagibaculum spongiae]|uniref:Sulfurtransferase n=1 Tax=Pelagibaculum spongiae TaxID=2080658 RepID=A0A2V1GSM9_9GAMM|nr:sulfurtransferase [Pelagibaculum spongiae]PVZ67723.1 thiosulfate sulfurtransferase [Pelagibaculum spongiae]
MTTSTTLPRLLEASQLSERLSDPQILLVDMGTAERYQQQHIPGAIFLDYNLLTLNQQPAPGLLPPLSQLKQTLASHGIDGSKTIIAYDDMGGGRSARLMWVLEQFGLKNSCYLNGGLPSWIRAGLPLESEVNLPEVVDNQFIFSGKSLISKTELLALLGEDQLVIWDARSPQEFSGEKKLANLAGHIPGAVNLDWRKTWSADDAMRMLPLKDLQRQLDQQGITKDKLIVTHCQTHHRSSYTWLIMTLLGYSRVKGYAGSWGEWGNSDDTPVEN